MLENKKFVICIDSDGCAMDTMNYKHFEFFGPLAADIWKIKDKKVFLEIWNRINLYSITRGVNRFKALYLTFEEMSKIDNRIVPLNQIKNWCLKTTKLSNDNLQTEIENNNSEELKKALEWSIAVNQGIENAKDKDKPYENVLDTLKKIKEFSDIVVVSSANHDAIMNEWSKHGLIKYVNEVMSQNEGSKAECIAKVKSLGYEENNILMIGDSPGDLEAANKNSVYFYPIIVGEEKNSWREFKDVFFEKFINKHYETVQKDLIEKFYKKLSCGKE